MIYSAIHHAFEAGHIVIVNVSVVRGCAVGVRLMGNGVSLLWDKLNESSMVADETIHLSEPVACVLLPAYIFVCSMIFVSNW